MSGTAGENAVVQLLPLIDYTLPELRRYTTGMLVLPTFLAVLLYRSAVVHVYLWGGRVWWYYMILGSTNFLRKCFMSRQRDRDCRVDPSHLELEECDSTITMDNRSRADRVTV